MVIAREFKGNLSFETLMKYEVEKILEKAMEKVQEVQYNKTQVGIVAKETLSEAIV